MTLRTLRPAADPPELVRRPGLTRILVIVLTGPLLGGCGDAPPPGSTSGGPADPWTVVYSCPDGFRFGARFREDSATVDLGPRTSTLGRVPSGSGARYEGNGVVLWSWGEEASLERDAVRHRGCQGTPAAGPWEEARLLGVEFRAVGQEPGWVLELHREGWLRIVADYGALTAVVEDPERVADETGAVVYRGEARGGEVTTVIREAPCRDTMSGEAFSYSVVLELNGRELWGCGRVTGERGPLHEDRRTTTPGREPE